MPCPPQSWIKFEIKGVFIVAIVLACQPRVRQFAVLTFKLSPLESLSPSNCPNGTIAFDDVTCQSVERAEGELVCVTNSAGRFAIDAAPEDRQGRTAATPAGCRQRCQKTSGCPPPSMPPPGAAAPLQPTLWRDITRLDDSLKLLTRPERERLLVSTSIEFDTVSAADFCKDYESVGITSRAWGIKCGLVSHLKAWNAPAKPTTALLGLLRTRGLRTVVFFGDSVGQQYFAALIQMLARDGSSCQDADGWMESTRGWAGVVAGNQSSRLLPPDNPPYSKCGNVPYVAQVRCDGVLLVQIGIYPHTWAKGSDLLQIVTTHLWEDVDAIVFNSGLHYAAELYGAALKHWLPMLQHFGARDGKLAIFRETSAQHFESVTGAYCTVPKPLGKTLQFESSRGGFRTPPESDALAGRPPFHPGTVVSGQRGC